MANENVLTPEFRVSFAYVFRPSKSNRPGDESKDPKYTITMLFPKNADLSALKKAAQQAAIDKWGADKIPKGLRSPFRDQGEKDYAGYEAGAVFVNASSKQKPGLVDARMNDIIEEKDFYSGCYARATVRAFAYDNSGNRGVSFGLQNLQKLRDGEPLGGRTRPSDDFQAVETASDAGSVFNEPKKGKKASLADLDDEIPF